MTVNDYNRYTYCLNNPLRYTDPSGYRFSFMESFNTCLDDPFYNLMLDDCLGGYLYDEDGGGGSGVGAPGSQGNGTGLNGVYYDWLSHTYRSTTSGNQVSWDFVQGVISPYTESIRFSNRKLGYYSYKGYQFYFQQDNETGKFYLPGGFQEITDVHECVLKMYEQMMGQDNSLGNVDWDEVANAALSLLGGIGEVIVGGVGEYFSAGSGSSACLPLIIDGGIRIATNATRLVGHLNGNSSFANAMPSNIGATIGKGIDMANGNSFYTYGMGQALGGATNDFISFVITGGTASALSNFVSNPTPINFGWYASAYLGFSNSLFYSFYPLIK